MNLPRKEIYLLVTMLCLLAGPVTPARAQDPTPFANCRLGVGGLQSDVVGYDMGQLNIGMYLDWRAQSSPPAGLAGDIDYIQVVRVHQTKPGDDWYGPPRIYSSPPGYHVWPDPTTLANMAASRPGSLWLIGNEIERVDWPEGSSWGGQDEILPEVYATAFHEIQAVIKAADPSARIAIGSVIEATPLRLEYLDRVWDSYYDQYGYSMGEDIDVWNVHGFILREVWNSWGAEIPAGLNDQSGFLSGLGDNYYQILVAHRNIAYFMQFTVALRSWMAAHGERDKPLINTECGILYRSLGGQQITSAQVSDYMNQLFDYALAATDGEIGYPADENRLLQGWFWYSLNDSFWNGNLFNPSTHALTTMGTNWRSYVSDPGNPLASLPQQNLRVINLRARPNPVFVPPGDSVTVTLRVDVANSGNTLTTSGNNIRVRFWDGVPGAPGSNLIASPIILDDIPGCGQFVTVEVEWPIIAAGEYTWYVEAMPIPNETDSDDNIASDVVEAMVLGGKSYLPLIMKK
jgi:hypothetical protein